MNEPLDYLVDHTTVRRKRTEPICQIFMEKYYTATCYGKSPIESESLPLLQFEGIPLCSFVRSIFTNQLRMLIVSTGKSPVGHQKIHTCMVFVVSLRKNFYQAVSSVCFSLIFYFRARVSFSRV